MSRRMKTIFNKAFGKVLLTVFFTDYFGLYTVQMNSTDWEILIGPFLILYRVKRPI